VDDKQVWLDTYHHIFKGPRGERNFPKWRGVSVVKMPSDLILYAQAIWEKKPDFIVETGTRWGGSALFFADMMALNGKGTVITVDVNADKKPEHPRVKYLVGRSTSSEIIPQVQKMIEGGTVMVVLDSLHTRVHVKRELAFYSKMVTPSQYLVVEDCCDRRTFHAGPAQAVDWFFSSPRPFIHVPVDRQFAGIGVTRDGWLQRR
jgi:cephalosporin hydroxylase